MIAASGKGPRSSLCVLNDFYRNCDCGIVDNIAAFITYNDRQCEELR